MAHTVIDSYVNVVEKGLMPFSDVPEKYKKEVTERLKVGTDGKRDNNGD